MVLLIYYYGVNPDHETMHDIYPSPNENEFDFISLGKQNDECEECDDDGLSFVFNVDEIDEEYGTFDPTYDEFNVEDDTIPTLPDFEDDVELEILPEFMEKLNESLDMFNRFKKYN